MATDTHPAAMADAGTMRRVATKHHWLVRWTHWLNIPILLGLILSGLSIYWAAPVYQHPADANGNQDYLADFGAWICRHVPGLHNYSAPTDWFYNHFSLGTGMLAEALRLHWVFAYLFMAVGLFYVIGLVRGGGYRSLLPRRGDFSGGLRMIRYYLGLPIAKVLRRPWHHPEFASKYNPLQRAAYFSVPLCGGLSVLTGWAIHKPTQLGSLAALFGGYDYARVWHFLLMWVFVLFVVPHVFLVLTDGWDTMRSMVVGWTERVSGGSSHAGPAE
jgi:thiosulfate reductase cytochrome b subunit